jgi:(4S)-4-hydroxy-5-phosphonooxypentane-2,3-dione isomerase
VYTLMVRIQVKPEHREEFLKGITELDARASLENEPGCLRFDVMVDESDPNVVLLYEVYRDKAAFEEHGKSAHIARWRAHSPGWAEGPATIWRGISHFPAAEAYEKQKI